MLKIVRLLCLFLALPAAVFAEPELKGTPSELLNYLSSVPKSVSLSGEAKLEIPAESGIVTLGIRTEDSKLQQALQDNQKLRSDITALLVQSGIAQERIRGTRFSSTPEYGLFGKKPNNYVVENVLKVTVENERELQEVAGLVDRNSDVFYQGMELKEKEKEEIRQKLLELALANASARQRVYESRLGIRLTPVGFEEYIAPTPPRPVMMQRAVQRDKAVTESGISVVGGGQLSLGEHVYQGSILVHYRVEPAPSK